jgi:WD40 repeat protein
MRPAPWFVLFVAAAVLHPREADGQVFTPKVILAGHKGGISDFCFSANGALLATSGFDDCTVKLWEVATGRERATFKTGGDHVRKIAFTPEGSVLAIVRHPSKTRGGGETPLTNLKVLDPDPAKARTLSMAGPCICTMSYSPDGKTLAVGSYTYASDGKRSDLAHVRLAFLDAATGRVRATLMEGKPVAFHLAFSRDGSTLATGGWDGHIRLWDVKTAKELAILHDSADWNGSRFYAPVFSPNGKYLASRAESNMVRVWYLSSLDPVMTFKGFRGPVGSVVYSPDGKLLAAGCSDKTLTFWDAETFVERAKIRAHENSFSSLAFSPDGKLVATGGADRLVKIWEVSHLLSGGSPAPVPAPAGVKVGAGDRR